MFTVAAHTPVIQTQNVQCIKQRVCLYVLGSKYIFQVILNVTLNIVGFAFAMTAIVLYSLNISQLYLWGICEYYVYSTESPWTPLFEEKCREKLLFTDVSVTSESLI